jgi:hypothetical protein
VIGTEIDALDTNDRVVEFGTNNDGAFTSTRSR